MNPNNLLVDRVAIKYKNKVYNVERPGRHHDVIFMIAKETGDSDIHGEQGFLLNNGKFVTRKAAANIAIRSNQIKSVAHPSIGLFSEDIW